MDDTHLPISHTCVFQLDVPDYSSADVMREKLLYAVRCCSAIDNDNRADGTLLGPARLPRGLCLAAH